MVNIFKRKKKVARYEEPYPLTNTERQLAHNVLGAFEILERFPEEELKHFIDLINTDMEIRVAVNKEIANQEAWRHYKELHDAG